jgi:hypothetical protein
MKQNIPGGKGSKRRKGSDQKKFSEGWDRLFGKKVLDEDNQAHELMLKDDEAGLIKSFLKRDYSEIDKDLLGYDPSKR